MWSVVFFLGLIKAAAYAAGSRIEKIGECHYLFYLSNQILLRKFVRSSRLWIIYWINRSNFVKNVRDSEDLDWWYNFFGICEKYSSRSITEIKVLKILTKTTHFLSLKISLKIKLTEKWWNMQSGERVLRDKTKNAILFVSLRDRNQKNLMIQMSIFDSSIKLAFEETKVCSNNHERHSSTYAAISPSDVEAKKN